MKEEGVVTSMTCTVMAERGKAFVRATAPER